MKKKTSCFNRDNSAKIALRHCKRLSGGCCQYILGSELQMKIGKWSGAMWNFNTILRMVVKCLFGFPSEGQKPEKGKKKATREFQPKIYATGADRCPAKYYKIFSSHRPAKMNSPDASFFLAINNRRTPGNQIWYMKSALGKNKIGKFMK